MMQILIVKMFLSSIYHDNDNDFFNSHFFNLPEKLKILYAEFTVEKFNKKN